MRCNVLRAVHEQRIYKKILSTDKSIPLIKSVFILKGENVLDAVKTLRYPLMVKPVSEGSSFGMSKVKNESQLLKAVEEAQNIIQMY